MQKRDSSSNERGPDKKRYLESEQRRSKRDRESDEGFAVCYARLHI